jgi:nucleoside-diphosphate-sugar epimerase
METVLVTGGAGFIGSSFAKIAQGRGFQIRVLDNLSTGIPEVASELGDMGIDVFIGDVRDSELLETVMKDVDIVIHLAAQVSVPISVENPDETASINIEGTNTLLSKCSKFGIKRFIVASSAAVYGENENFPLTELDGGDLLSPYAESKWENEHQISKAREDGLEAVALRFFNVYGIGQRPDSAYAAVIPKFIEMMVQGKAPQVHGDGLQTRDFVHVNDVCSAILRFLDPVWFGATHHVFNVATQTRISLVNLVEEINSSLAEVDHSHVPLEPKFGSNRPGDIRHSMADITRLKEATNWRPTVNFTDGIRELVAEAYKQNLQKKGI